MGGHLGESCARNTAACQDNGGDWCCGEREVRGERGGKNSPGAVCWPHCVWLLSLHALSFPPGLQEPGNFNLLGEVDVLPNSGDYAFGGTALPGGLGLSSRGAGASQSPSFQAKHHSWGRGDLLSGLCRLRVCNQGVCRVGSTWTLSLCPHMVFPLCVCVVISSKDTHYIGSGPP